MPEKVQICISPNNMTVTLVQQEDGITHDIEISFETFESFVDRLIAARKRIFGA